MTAGNNPRIHVGIIGGGITGVILALALEKRGVSYTLYERAPAFTELGAGIGFSPNAERALKVVDPKVYKVYKSVASSHPDEEYFQWVDGSRSNEVMARLLIGVDEFQGGRRSDFLEAWSTLIPSHKTKFSKEIKSIVQKDDGKVALIFKDGSEEECDVAIGCDGIRSRVRQLILGEANPAAYPRYSKKFCFRALLPMDKAQQVVGEKRARERFMYNGPDAHIITYPVARNAFLNALFVISDQNAWPSERHTAPGDKQEAVRVFANWHPAVRGLVDLLPEKLDKWAIFDMYDCPTTHYHLGSVALAGDAAHASGPHLGSGAGFGIEDALVLASVLKLADDECSRTSGEGRRHLCRDALAAYNAARFDRDQWLPGATRKAVELFQWQDEEVRDDRVKFLKHITPLYHKIWKNDIDEMVRSAEEQLRLILEKQSTSHL
ncbi:hypothetical protein F5Y18DRAFT_432340 [Xylariaceae sp. FL1019]|nr:hypothetical protein F5Y18DRAFT_432340 [Xylariaceae sp. FL1019]